MARRESPRSLHTASFRIVMSGEAEALLLAISWSAPGGWETEILITPDLGMLDGCCSCYIERRRRRRACCPPPSPTCPSRGGGRSSAGVSSLYNWACIDIDVHCTRRASLFASIVLYRAARSCARDRICCFTYTCICIFARRAHSNEIAMSLSLSL